jgi:hypothetical protein
MFRAKMARVNGSLSRLMLLAACGTPLASCGSDGPGTGNSGKSAAGGGTAGPAVANPNAQNPKPEADAGIVTGPSPDTSLAPAQPTPSTTTAPNGTVVEETTDPVIIDGEDDPVPAAPAECAHDSYQGERVKVNLYLLLDNSGSMRSPIAVDSTVTQWDAVRDAIKDFIGSPESEGLNLAMNYYPILGDRALCNRRNQCDNGYQCIAKVCAIEFLYDAITLCDTDQDCKLTFTDADGEVYRQRCMEPQHCTGSDTAMCLVDEQCKDGAICEDETVAVCPGETSCTSTDYATPSVARAELPMQSQAFIDSLDAHEPDIFAATPTHIALQGAYSQVQDWIDAEPDAKSFLILATDGAPTGCTNANSSDEDVNLATDATYQAITDAEGRGIDTFVIGVVPNVSGLDPNDPAIVQLQAQFDLLAEKLDTMAQKGGTKMPYNIEVGMDTTQSFLDALSAIRGAVLPCEYAIPKPEKGTVSFDRLNVELSQPGADMGTTIPKVDTQADCVDGESAWYYDLDPDTQTPRRVELCPAACDAANAAAGASIDIVLGCQTVIRVR